MKEFSQNRNSIAILKVFAKLDSTNFQSLFFFYFFRNYRSRKLVENRLILLEHLDTGRALKGLMGNSNSSNYLAQHEKCLVLEFVWSFLSHFLKHECTKNESTNPRIQSEYGNNEPEKLWLRMLFSHCVLQSDHEKAHLTDNRQFNVFSINYWRSKKLLR